MTRLQSLLLKYKAKHSYSCVLVPVTGELKEKVLELSKSVPDDLLATDGREDDPHITLLFGLHSSDSAPVAHLLSEFNRPLSYALGAVSVFENDEHDVLKVEVHSLDLPMLHHYLRSHLPNTQTHLHYSPHVTLAYVKKGTGRNLARRMDRLDLVGRSDEVIFSDSNRKHTRIQLVDEATKYKVEGEVTLGEPVQKKHYTGANLYEHPVLDQSGSSIGTVRVIPREQDLHLEWAGLSGTAPGERSGEFGPEAANSIRRQLADHYPDQTHLTGFRASGVRQGVKFRVPLRRQQVPLAPAGDPFENLKAMGILKDKFAAMLNECIKYDAKPTFTKKTYWDIGNGYSSIHHWSPVTVDGQLMWSRQKVENVPTVDRKEFHQDALPLAHFMPEYPTLSRTQTWKAARPLTEEEQQEVYDHVMKAGDVDWRSQEMIPEDVYAMQTSDVPVRYSTVDSRLFLLNDEGKRFHTKLLSKHSPSGGYRVETYFARHDPTTGNVIWSKDTGSVKDQLYGTDADARQHHPDALTLKKYRSINGTPVTPEAMKALGITPPDFSNEATALISDAVDKAGRLSSIDIYNPLGHLSDEERVNGTDNINRIKKIGDLGARQLHGMAAVLADKRPATVVSDYFVNSHPVGQEAMRHLIDAGHVAESTDRFGGGHKIVGKPDAVQDALSAKADAEFRKALGHSSDGSQKYAARNPVKYEEKGELQTHPDIAGFQLEHFLKHLSADSTLSQKGREYAQQALTTANPGHLWQLSDELHDTDHPLAGKYRLLQAASDIALDRATGEAVRTVAGSDDPPDHQVALQHLMQANYDVGEPHPAAVEAVGILKGQKLEQDEIDRSLQRHQQRLARGDRHQSHLNQQDALTINKNDPERYQQDMGEYDPLPSPSEKTQPLTHKQTPKQRLMQAIAQVKARQAKKRWDGNYDYDPLPKLPEKYRSLESVLKYGLLEDEVGFHKAMAENPHETHIPLIYADWLEENGRPAMAKLVRLHTNNHNDRVDFKKTEHDRNGGETGLVPDYSTEGGMKEQGPFVPPAVAHMPPYKMTDPPDRPDTKLSIGFAYPSNTSRAALDLSQRALHNPKEGFFWQQWLPNSEALELVEALRKEGVPLAGTDVPEHVSEGGRSERYYKTLLAHSEPDKSKTLEVPEKYRSSPALSDFIHAVRQVRSSSQQVRRQLAEEQAKKLKLRMESLTDAISDAPHTASANTAQAVEHDGDLDKVRVHSALYGLATNSPSLLVFHEHPEGDDRLHLFTVQGSAEKLRKRMDSAGILNRTLLPTETGWSAVVFDPNGLMQEKMVQFAQSEGSPLQTSKGSGEVLGDSPEAEADESTRKSYRSVIRQYERQQQEGQFSA